MSARKSPEKIDHVCVRLVELDSERLLPSWLTIRWTRDDVKLSSKAKHSLAAQNSDGDVIDEERVVVRSDGVTELALSSSLVK